MKCMPSFIKIGGAVSEKNDYIRQTFVVLYIGFLHGFCESILKKYTMFAELNT